MESKLRVSGAPAVDLAAMFSELVRLEIELWNLVDDRLRTEHDLPLTWFEPMHVIDRVPHCRVADIAGELSITVGGTSKLVDRIELAGFCSRAPNPDDARSSVLALSRRGRRLLSAARRTLDDELADLIGAAVSPKRLAGLASTLRDVRQHVADRQGATR